MIKISVNDVEVLTLTDTQVKVLEDKFPADKLMDEITRQINWLFVDTLVNKQLDRLVGAWTQPEKKDDGTMIESRLIENQVTSIPLNKLELAELIFAQDRTKPYAYKNRKIRATEETLANRREVLPLQIRAYEAALAISSQPDATPEQMQHTADLLAIVTRIQGEIARLEAELAAQGVTP